MSFRARILIADDDAGFQKATVRLLQSEQYFCECVPDGETALVRLSENEYNVLIADIRMPGNQELQLIQKVAEVSRGLPVILVTGHPSLETAMMSVELPVFAYVPKPYESEAMLNYVDAAAKCNLAYRSVVAVENQLITGMTNAAMMDRLMVAAKGDRNADTKKRSVVTLAFSNIVSAMSDLHVLINSLHSDELEKSICTITDCPRAQIITQALENTIEILRATKSDFKSKKIADLRHNLELVLAEEKRHWTQGEKLKFADISPIIQE